MINRILGVLFLLLAAVVGFLFIFWNFLGDSLDDSIWEVVNIPMAVAVVASLGYAIWWMRNLDDDASDRTIIKHKALLLGTVLLIMWFFSAWGTESATGLTEAAEVLSDFYWFFVDPLFVITVGCVGCTLWCKGAGQHA